MKLVIRPIQNPHREIDVTHRLVSAIAAELWRLYGGNEELNWLEAELHLGRMVGEARAAASETELLLIQLRVPTTTRAAPPVGGSTTRYGRGSTKPHRGQYRPLAVQ